MSTKSRRTHTARSASMSVTTTKRSAAKPAASPSGATPAVELSKQDQLIEMLRSPEGGTMQQLVDLTGWQAHTVRGTVNGVLRKRLKLTEVCSPVAGSRVYRLVEARA